LQDGRHLLVYNHDSTPKHRTPLNVAISPDGKKWFAALVLESDAAAPNGFAYPAVIQTRDGLVHVTYTWKRERIKHTVIDLTKLQLRPMVDKMLLWPD
jgi:predicted neuraminidase